jgi:hypothetical protein
LDGSGGKCDLYTKPMSEEDLAFRYTLKKQSKKLPCVTHMNVFGSLVYAMDLDEILCKIDARRIKCMFCKYYKGMKAYRLMCLETKKIMKSRDVGFMEGSGSIRNDLVMRPSGRNIGLIIVVLDKSSKAPLFDDGG